MLSTRSGHAKLGSILHASIEIINAILPCLNSSFEDPVQKRSIVRKIIILGEIFAYIRNSDNQEHPLLKSIYELKSEPDKTESLLDVLNIRRNKLAHPYIIEHLMKNENHFIDAINFCNSNLSVLKTLITDINSKLTPDDSEKDIVKRIGQTPQDDSQNSALDYLCYSLEEISQLENILNANNTSMLNTQSLKQFLKSENYINNSSLKEAILNTVENVLTLLDLSNRKFQKEKLITSENTSSADEDNSSGILSKAQLLQMRQALPKHLTLLLTKANEIRRVSVHNWNNLIADNVLKEHILNISQLRMKYLNLIISDLHQAGFKFKATFRNNLSALSINTPSESSTSSMFESSDLTLQRQASASRGNISADPLPTTTFKRKHDDFGISGSSQEQGGIVEIDEKTGLPFFSVATRTNAWDKFNKKYKTESTSTAPSESSEYANQPEKDEEDVDKPPQGPSRPGQS